jgi:hypothetical protein
MDAEGDQEEGEIRPEREKTDAGRTLLNEARDTEGGAPYIRRLALVPTGQIIDPKSIMQSIIDMMKCFVNDPAGSAHAAVFNILETQPLSADNRMILNGPSCLTIHRAVEVSHTNVELMQLFDAMVTNRNEHGGIDVLGVPLYFVHPRRASEMAAETVGMKPPEQHTFMPSHLIEVGGMGTGLSMQNLDEIGDKVCTMFNGLNVATLMRCRIRDDLTGAPLVVAGHE